MTSAFLKEALDKGAELFNWEERKARSGKRVGSKVRGVGVAVSAYSAGSIGFDGLLVIKPDGRRHDSVGHRQPRHRVGVRLPSRRRRGARTCRGRRCDVIWGNTSKNLPNTCGQGGSQTTHAMTRAAHAAGSDAKKKLQEIAAKTLGGSPESYQVANERVSGGGRQHDVRAGGAEGDRARRQVRRPRAAERHQRLHEDVGDRARRSGADGRGARQLRPRRHLEVVRRGLRRGRSRRRDRASTRSSTTWRSPTSARCCTRGTWAARFSAASCSASATRIGQKWVYDQHYGVPLAKRFYQTKPPTILDAPAKMQWAALDIPDPETPVGVARRRRGAGRRGVRRRRERDRRRGRRRDLPARAGHGRHDPDGARSGPADARSR